MRVSTDQTQQAAVNAMLEQQAKLSNVQQQVATGSKITKPSDNPVDAAKVVNLRDILSKTDQYKSNISIARARLNLEEGTLSHVGDVYHRIRELAVEANNATQTNETRRYIGDEVSQLLDELLALANSTDSTGHFLFSGNKGQFKPFARNNNGSFDYFGDDSQRMIQIGPRRRIAVNDSGNEIFRQIRDGNGKFTVLDSPRNRGSGVIDQGHVIGKYDLGTYAIVFDSKPKSVDPNTPLTYHVIDSKGNIIVPPGHAFTQDGAIEFRGIHTSIEGKPAPGDYFVIRPSYNQDIFTTLQGFVDALRVGLGTPGQHARFHNEVNRILTAMDSALGRTLDVRATIGARLNALDNQASINGALKIQIKKILSGVEDLDYSKAVSELNLKLTSLQASQKAFTRVQGISLFNYL